MGKNYTYSMFDSNCFNRLGIILIITFLINVIVLVPAAAQQKIVEIGKYISENTDAQEASRIEELVFEVQPTVYINDGEFAPKGDGPMTVASIGAKSMGKIQEGHPTLQSIRLLLITFKDLQELQSFRLQPANLGSMPNLAYVFLSLGFDDAPAEIFSGIQGFDGSEIVFLYESARPF